MPSGDGYHVIVAILLLPHEPPKDEPAQQHDAANSFSNRLPPGGAGRRKLAAREIGFWQ
jgi:hypothetical protein